MSAPSPPALWLFGPAESTPLPIHVAGALQSAVLAALPLDDRRSLRASCRAALAAVDARTKRLWRARGEAGVAALVTAAPRFAPTLRALKVRCAAPCGLGRPLAAHPS